MQKDRIAIIGGGAGGIMAALFAKNSNNQVDIYEKNQALGKKISISGNGRCNIFNANLKRDDFFGEDLSFLEYALREYDFPKFRRFCEDLGLFLKVEEDGKVYPLSNQAKSVLEIFDRALKERGVNIFLSNEVLKVEQKEGIFEVVSKDKKAWYDKILIACGGKSAPNLGGGESGYEIAKKFGHTISPLYPALVQLETKIDRVLIGVKTKAKVSIIDKEYRGISFTNDLLFTKYGLSGFSILDISLYVSKALLSKESVVLSLNLLPDFERSFLEDKFLKISKKYPKREVVHLLVGFLPLQIAKFLTSRLKLERKNLQDIGVKSIKQIVATILDLRFEVKKTHGFKYAEVCGGGVDISMVDRKSFESKLVKNLFFAGEVLDITGKRGGYNLAFAFISGYLSGKAMTTRDKI